MLDKKKEYCSFLLTLKQVQTDDLQTWVVALRNVRTGGQQMFSNLDGLIRFLRVEFDNTTEEEGPTLAVTPIHTN